MDKQIQDPYPSEGSLLRPVPFEDPEAAPKLWERIVGMFRLAFTKPMELFERVPMTEGLAAPWRFYLLMSVPYILFMGLFLLLLAALGFTAFAAAAKARPALLASGIGVGILVGLLVLTPLFVFLGMVIIGALDHFALWIWGGTRNGVGIGQTIRAAGYANGIYLLVMLPLQVLGMIPFIGILFSMLSFPLAVAFLVFKGMGLARMHRTDAWRGITAEISILVVGVCCAVLLALGFFLLLMKQMGGHW